ncbi:MAG: GspE/PulE family protein [Candidatus Sabulitectum sp.]|nr:GspE/PulE family protein [Candidatus Sabulitectum sp.]
MAFAIPKLTRRNTAVTRIACLVISILVMLAISYTPSSKEALAELESNLRIGSAVFSLLFRGILVFLFSAVLVRLITTLWLRFEEVPENTAVIKRGDLCINTTRGIAAIPMYQSKLRSIIESSEGTVVEIVNSIISMGFSLNASDIHISPDPDRAEVVYRIHGNLYPIGEISQLLYPHLVRRIKILSSLSIFKHGVPQDGKLNFEDKTYTARVSVFPTSNGERIALRLANVNARIMDLENIGMPENILLDYKALLNRSQGMIVITGPTGSGKSTTMFSSLLSIQAQRKDSVNIVTLEDPIETNLKGFQQTQVGQATGLTFPAALRSVLRQDPDVIMLGEIRDEETASIAIRAAMTGHLLLTTVHANSTSGVFNRLSQMGVDPVQLSSTVHAVLSQRLCRQLCPSCRKIVELTDSLVRQLKLLGVNNIPEAPFYEAEGCTECLGHGFIGRVALFEMFIVTDNLRNFISRGLPSHQLSREAKKAGMQTLLDHGLKYALEGKISLTELTRVVSE